MDVGGWCRMSMVRGESGSPNSGGGIDYFAILSSFPFFYPSQGWMDAPPLDSDAFVNNIALLFPNFIDLFL